MIMNTYKVTGTLVRTVNGKSETLFINGQIEARNNEEALAYFEKYGYEFLTGVQVVLISEAAKMEEAGQPALFALEDYNAN